jgi:hypothetical protein
MFHRLVRNFLQSIVRIRQAKTIPTSSEALDFLRQRHILPVVVKGFLVPGNIPTPEHENISPETDSLSAGIVNQPPQSESVGCDCE